MSLTPDFSYVDTSLFERYGLRDLLYSQKIAILQELDELIHFRIDEAMEVQEKKGFSPDAMITQVKMQTIRDVMQQWQSMKT